MIHIKRGPAPDFLLSNIIITAKDALERTFFKKKGQERFRFETSLMAPIKQSLLEMCNNKCAYCETHLHNGMYGNIETFRPKSGARGFNNEYAPLHYWWLAYDWDNLIISCEICDQKYKRDYFPLEDESLRAKIGAKGEELEAEKPLLINPTLDQPQEHFQFENSGEVKALTARGKATIDILGLNRMELIERRKRTATELSFNLEVLKTGNVFNDQASSLTTRITELFSDNTSKEFVALQRTVFTNWLKQNKSTWDKIGSGIGLSDALRIGNLKSYAIKSSFPKEQQINSFDDQLSNIKRFSIKSIELKNFKSIDELKIEVLSNNDQEKRESWLLLLGDNGIGKSSILQGIALTLAGKNQLKKLDLQVNDYLKRGKQSGFVRIYSYEHDKPIELHFNKKGFTTTLEEAPTFIMAYGSTRLMPKGTIKPDSNKEPYLNIRNLFDYSVALEDPIKWLCEIQESEFQDRIAPAFYDILALSGKDKLHRDKGTINIRHYGNDHELDDNSDGYKTIVALVADMMQTLAVDNASFHNSQGIVLIDEIGNHLHPRWRLKIVSALRKAFPKLQFIVTTHEPLCLRGLTHGEVMVLVRDENKNVRALDSKLLPDHSKMRIEQLLTSDLFGLINVVDEETEKTYEEYYKLLSKKDEEKTAEEKNRIREMSILLGQKEILGNTPVDQIYFKVLETFANKVRTEGFKTREELKDETIIEVKDLLLNKNISWL